MIVHISLCCGYVWIALRDVIEGAEVGEQTEQAEMGVSWLAHWRAM